MKRLPPNGPSINSLWIHWWCWKRTSFWRLSISTCWKKFCCGTVLSRIAKVHWLTGGRTATWWRGLQVSCITAANHVSYDATKEVLLRCEASENITRMMSRFQSSGSCGVETVLSVYMRWRRLSKETVCQCFQQHAATEKGSFWYQPLLNIALSCCIGEPSPVAVAGSDTRWAWAWRSSPCKDMFDLLVSLSQAKRFILYLLKILPFDNQPLTAINQWKY